MIPENRISAKQIINAYVGGGTCCDQCSNAQPSPDNFFKNASYKGTYCDSDDGNEPAITFIEYI